jgi:ubiquinone/menaquinone biosynthesis C-methylase UbiE
MRIGSGYECQEESAFRWTIPNLSPGKHLLRQFEGCLNAQFTANLMHDSLPKYADRLESLHHALEDDFRRIVRSVPLGPEQTVLDVGCGDGFFTSLLAESNAKAVGLDTSEAFLQRAREAAQGKSNLQFAEGDARKLPVEDVSVDALWSAHSMHSYPDKEQCLREFHRVLRPGGTLAVLESDNVHSVMLSWPPDLELAIRQAEHGEIGDEDSYIGTYFPRFAMSLLTQHGFERFEPIYFFIHRHGPASEALTKFVRLYLEDLLERTSDWLSDKQCSRLAQLADPGSDKFLPRQKTFFFGSLQVLMLARAPQ